MAQYKSTVGKEIATLIQARENCIKTGNAEWLLNHTSRLKAFVEAHMPSGGGIDSGTTIDLDRSTSDKLVFQTSFHHMSEYGSYDGWTEHTVTVRASLTSTFDIRIGGRDRNDIKDHLHQTFYWALRAEVVLGAVGTLDTVPDEHPLDGSGANASLSPETDRE